MNTYVAPSCPSVKFILMCITCSFLLSLMLFSVDFKPRINGGGERGTEGGGCWPTMTHHQGKQQQQSVAVPEDDGCVRQRCFGNIDRRLLRIASPLAFHLLILDGANAASTQ